MAGKTVLRQTLKLGAGCGNSACPELSGGQGVTLVPTGMFTKLCEEAYLLLNVVFSIHGLYRDVVLTVDCKMVKNYFAC